MYRDVDPVQRRSRGGPGTGRSVIAVIGIDQYVAWPRLSNAVSDAEGAARLFKRLGFKQVTAPLLGRDATRNAMHRLVTGTLTQLTPDDSLVLFFAGHGHTQTTHAGDAVVKTGYVIPVDATRGHADAASTWLRLDAWLSDIARLPPRHILVIIDACHSGCALTAMHKWREETVWPTTQLDALWARRSRRVITSALDGQRALDSGPYEGHSLFTGCLIEALSGGLGRGGKRVTTGRELGQYVHRRVTTFPGSTQIPDFGAFELDDRGDILIPVLASGPESPAMRSPAATLQRPTVAPVSLAPFPSAPVLRKPGPPGEDETATHRLGPRASGGPDVQRVAPDERQPSGAGRPDERRVGEPLRAAGESLRMWGSRRGGWLLVALYWAAIIFGVGALMGVRPGRSGSSPRYVAPEPEDTPDAATRSANTSANPVVPPHPSAIPVSEAIDTRPDASTRVSSSAAEPVPEFNLRFVETEITATVDGAMVEVVGTDQSGPAPFTAKLQEGKPYKVRFTARGFATYEDDIKGGDPKQTVKLIPKPRFLTITSDPPGAQISIDGTATERTTPSELELSAAQAARKWVRVVLRKAGFRAVDRTIDFAKFADGDTRMTAKLDEKLTPAPPVTRPGP